MNYECDIAIVGSGFAGSFFAMIAKRLGRSVILVDRGRHPRVVIGESSTPITNLLLEELAIRYDLPALTPLTKWGTWQKEYPEIACGLKRGFTFYHHDRHHPSTPAPSRERQLLVAASPNDEVADTHWYRADFDQFLLKQAQSMGVPYLDEANLTSATELRDGLLLEGLHRGASLGIRAKFAVDASGARGFLHQILGLSESQLPDFPRTQAIYNHFSGVRRLDALEFGINRELTPYPIDAAAVHHVFEGGWIWVLQFNNGVTSAGVAATHAVAAEMGFHNPATAWQSALAAIPALREQFATAVPERAFRHILRLSFRSSTITGKRWALLPSAAGFIDPLLSTGFPLTLLGIGRLAELIERDWDSDRFVDGLRDYAVQTDQELLASSRLIAALYANMDNFTVFSAVSLLYFAAVSYSETVRRLGRTEPAKSFLLHDHPVFGTAMRDLLERSRHLSGEEASTALIADIYRAIEPFNLAGFGDASRRNWYPVEAADLYNSADKVGASQEEISQLLVRSGFQ